MLHKTRGIVLSYIKYKETSIIARIYTEEFGIQSYIINSVRSQRSKKGLALVQPLTILDLVVYHKSEKADGLHRISEYKPAYNFKSIPFDIKKSSIAIFVTELLTMVLQEEEHHGAVFEFLFQFIKTLDEKNDQYESLHVYLLIQLTHYIGFGIHKRQELERHNISQSGSISSNDVFSIILELNEKQLNDKLVLSNELRRDTINYMINYYRHHIEGFKNMKSLEVLSQIFR